MRWTPFSTLLFTGSRRLLVRALPWTVAVVALKAVLGALGWEPLDLSPLLAAAIGAEVFVVGFLLTGVAADFKEAEHLPGDLGAGLETITDHLLTALARGGRAADQARVELERVVEIGRLVSQWLAHESDLDDVMSELHRLHAGAAGIEVLAPHTAALNNEQSTIRRTLLRMGTMRRTSYVAAGYLFGEIVAAALVAVMLLTDLGDLAPTLVMVGLVSFLLMYLVALVRDLDNPFEYLDGRPGDADVDLGGLHASLRRITRLIARDDDV